MRLPRSMRNTVGSVCKCSTGNSNLLTPHLGIQASQKDKDKAPSGSVSPAPANSGIGVPTPAPLRNEPTRLAIPQSDPRGRRNRPRLSDEHRFLESLRNHLALPNIFLEAHQDLS
jgi:hypothetical protein